LCGIVDQGYRSGSNLTGLSFMEAESETTDQDGPAALPPFRFLAAGTFTGGKSFWLGCQPPSPNPNRSAGREQRSAGGRTDRPAPRRQEGDF
jgi:hypothetical protein